MMMSDIVLLGDRHDHKNAVVHVVSVSLYFTIAIVGLRSSCSCCGVLVALGWKDVLAMLLIANVSTLLFLVKDF